MSRSTFKPVDVLMFNVLCVPCNVELSFFLLCLRAIVYSAIRLLVAKI